MRRQIAAVAVVALLLFAGCNGGSGPATTTTPSGQTTDQSPDGGTAPIYEAPLNPSEVADAHTAVIQEAGTYTVRSNSTQSSSAQNLSVETTTVVRGNVDTGAVFTSTESGQQTIETYILPNGTAYRRYGTGDSAQYQTVTTGVGNASQFAEGSVGTFVTLFEFSYQGTETQDGSTVYVYESSGAENLNTSAPAFSGINKSAVSEATAHLHVREDGLVTSVGYTITLTVNGDERSVTAVQEYGDLGSTTVEEPAWLPDARANTGDSGSTTTASA